MSGNVIASRCPLPQEFAGVIDIAAFRVNVCYMETDDNLPRAGDDRLAALAAEDLDPLSIAELEARIASLTLEIDRVRRHIDKVVKHRSSADALFRR